MAPAVLVVRERSDGRTAVGGGDTASVAVRHRLPAGSSSIGSDAMATHRPGRTDSACAPRSRRACSPSVSSRFSRGPGRRRDAPRGHTRPATASSGSCPARQPVPDQRPQQRGVGRRVQGEQVGHRQAAAASSASVSGQPAITPLWLNSQRPVGERGAGASPLPASRPSPSGPRRARAVLRDRAASAANAASVQIGIGPPVPDRRRHRRRGYQPAPNPSALMVPPARMSAGA